MSAWKHGCCVDRDCNTSTCMSLPEGQTCKTCAHHRRCTMMFGAKSDNDYCQFFPRRFKLAVVEENHEQGTP